MNKGDIVTIQLPGKEPVDAICFETYRAYYQLRRSYDEMPHSAILLDAHGYLYTLAPNFRVPVDNNNPYCNEIVKYPLEIINLKEICTAISNRKVPTFLGSCENFEDAEITDASDSEHKDQLRLIESNFYQIIREHTYLMSWNNDIEQQIRALAQKKEENKDEMCECFNQLMHLADDLQQNIFEYQPRDISDDFGQEMDE